VTVRTGPPAATACHTVAPDANLLRLGNFRKIHRGILDLRRLRIAFCFCVESQDACRLPDRSRHLGEPNLPQIDLRRPRLVP